MRENLHQQAPPCEFKEQLVAYLYGELAPAQTRSFEEHMRVCASCRQDVEDFRSVRQALSLWEVNEVPRVIVQVKASFWQTLVQVFRVAPAWGKLLAGAMATLVILAIFNVQIELSRTTGFRFRASLLPVRTGTALENRQGLDQQQIAAILDEKIRQMQQQQQERLLSSLEEAVRQIQTEQTTTLVDLIEKSNYQQRQQLAGMLRELETPRSGALTFSDIFFDRGGN